MTLAIALKLYAIAFALFIVIDLVWLGFVATGVYRKYMGDIMRDQPIWPVAIVFYLLFVVGLTYFAIAPAVDGGSMQDALVKGALFGFFTYATFDLTSWAVLKGYPAAIVPIDMTWGTVLGASVSTGTYALYDRFLA